MIYLAIISDVIGSKEASADERRNMQMKIIQVLRKINSQYEEQIVSNFTLTLGDEFQGLLKKNAAFCEIIDKIQLMLHPINVRVGIGLGEIYTDNALINKELSIGSDGPAYWHARAAIEQLHKKNDYGITKKMLKADIKQLAIINNTFRLCDAIEESWTTGQKEYIYKIIQLYGYKKPVHKKLATELGISAQHVSNNMKATNFYQYIESKATIQMLIASIGGTA